MRLKTHTAIAMAASSLVMPLAQDNLAVPMVFLAGSVAGAYIVDIDTPNSTIGQKHKVISTALTLTAGHRGILHSPFFAIIVSGILSILTIYTNGINSGVVIPFLNGFTMGWILHILADSFSNSGVPLLYPISKKHYGLKICKSFGIIDYMLGTVCSAIAAYSYVTQIINIIF